MNHFRDCFNERTIKARFRELALRFHPDKGGSNEQLRELIDQYHAALKDQNDTAAKTETGTEYRYYYNRETESQTVDKLTAAIGAGLTGCEIWLVGTWVWVRGTVTAHKLALEALGFRESNKHQDTWIWNPEGKLNRRKRTSKSFDSIVGRYGGTRHESEDKRRIA